MLNFIKQANAKDIKVSASLIFMNKMTPEKAAQYLGSDGGTERGTITIAPKGTRKYATCVSCYTRYRLNSLMPVMKQFDTFDQEEITETTEEADSIRNATKSNHEKRCVYCLTTAIRYCGQHEVFFLGKDGQGTNKPCPICSFKIDSVEEMMSMPSSNAPVGMPSARFPRHVGLEIETGPINLSKKISGKTFLETMGSSLGGFAVHTHSDGSLERSDSGAGMEMTTPPVRGLEVTKYGRKIYNTVKTFGHSVENILAGAHVHVDARDLFVALAKRRGPDDKQYKLFRSYFDGCLRIAKRLVSKRRRTNSYCREPFGIRNMAEVAGFFVRRKNLFPDLGYCGIAIRAKTLEFRIWPSTNCLAYHLARVELSSKMVHTFVNTKEEDRPALINKLEEIIVQKNTDSWCEMVKNTFAISTVSMGSLRALFEKYMPTDHRVISATPTADRMLVTEEIPDPDDYRALREAISRTLRSMHPHIDLRESRAFADATLCHSYFTKGDTLIFCPDAGLGRAFYLDTETLEPVPAGSSPYRYRM